MKKAIVAGALVWFLVMGGFLRLFKKTVKVMRRKEKFSKLSAKHSSQQAPQPVSKYVGKSQLLMPNNYIAPALPLIETQQVPYGQPA